MKNGLKIPLVFLLLLLSLPVFSQLVYDNNQDNENITVSLLSSGGTYRFGLFQEVSTSSTTNRTHTIYVPLAGSTGGLDNRDYSYFEDRTELPQISAGSSPTGMNLLQFNLYIDVVGDFDHLKVGMSTESSATTFQVIGSQFPTYSDGARAVNVDFRDICDDSDLFDCSKFNLSDSPTDDDILYLFFFLDDEDLTKGTSVTKEDYSGVVYEVKLSNRVYESLPRLTALAKGDSQLVGTLDGFELDYDFDSWYVHIDSSTCTDTATNETLKSLGLSFSNLRDLNNISIDGVVRVNELTNGTCYSLRYFECDKYGFCSKSTEQLSGTPEEIQALLEKQACFFFTAGFNGEHYVVTYFQYWRDHFLSKFWLGQKFIRWYYDTAPQYTPYILERPWLQSIIKGIGFVLYGVIKGWWLILGGLVVLSAFARAQKRKFKY